MLAPYAQIVDMRHLMPLSKVCFVCLAAAEWGPEVAAEYDISGLESPRLSDSAQAVRECDSKDPHFTLQQCVEVCEAMAAEAEAVHGLPASLLSRSFMHHPTAPLVNLYTPKRGCTGKPVTDSLSRHSRSKNEASDKDRILGQLLQP
jgi:hypothetical protein